MIRVFRFVFLSLCLVLLSSCPQFAFKIAPRDSMQDPLADPLFTAARLNVAFADDNCEAGEVIELGTFSDGAPFSSYLVELYTEGGYLCIAQEADIYLSGPGSTMFSLNMMMVLSARPLSSNSLSNWPTWASISSILS